MNFSVEAECGYNPYGYKALEGTSVEYVMARPGGKLLKNRGILYFRRYRLKVYTNVFYYRIKTYPIIIL